MSRFRDRRPPPGGPPPAPPPPDGTPLATPPPVSTVDPVHVEPVEHGEIGVAEVEAVEVADDLASIDALDSQLVLRRAIQLADDNLMMAERFPVGSIEQVAAELHIPVTAVADALAEYRAGAIDRPAFTRSGESKELKRGLLDRLVGPRSVKVRHRTTMGDDEAVEHVSYWLKRRHKLRTRVDVEGTVVGVRRRGVVPIMARTVRSATGSAGLAGVKEVRAAAVAADRGSTSLCFVVDVSGHRKQSVAAGSAVATGGSLVVGAVAVVAGPATLVGVPVAVGAGWVASRITHRYRVRRITEEMEITADQVAAGANPPTLTTEVAERLTARRRPER